MCDEKDAADDDDEEVVAILFENAADDADDEDGLPFIGKPPIGEPPSDRLKREEPLTGDDFTALPTPFVT